MNFELINKNYFPLNLVCLLETENVTFSSVFANQHLRQPQFQIVPQTATIPEGDQISLGVILQRMDVDFDDENIPATMLLSGKLTLDFNCPLITNRAFDISATFKKVF